MHMERASELLSLKVLSGCVEEGEGGRRAGIFSGGVASARRWLSMVVEAMCSGQVQAGTSVLVIAAVAVSQPYRLSLDGSGSRCKSCSWMRASKVGKLLVFTYEELKPWQCKKLAALDVTVYVEDQSGMEVAA